MLFSKIIKKKFDAVLGRYEGDPAVYTFSPRDFPEIRSDPFDIPGDRGITLKGAFYYYGEPDYGKLVVFDHGIFDGHLAYFREIEYLAGSGYTVYSYDHTGCAATGGTGIGGFAQGINDLDHVLTALQKDPRIAGKSVRLMGHSWGGYSCMNAAALHPEITHVVSLAGFLSAKALVEQYIPKPFLKYSPEVMGRERQLNPRYADMDARESLRQSGAKLMHLQSDDDKMVKYDLCYVPLQEALKDRDNTVLLTLHNRNHDPQRTEAACRGWEEMMRSRESQRKQLNTPEKLQAFQDAQNWRALTEQDPEVWKQILDFLK